MVLRCNRAFSNGHNRARMTTSISMELIACVRIKMKSEVVPLKLNTLFSSAGEIVKNALELLENSAEVGREHFVAG